MVGTHYAVFLLVLYCFNTGSCRESKKTDVLNKVSECALQVTSAEAKSSTSVRVQWIIRQESVSKCRKAALHGYKVQYSLWRSGGTEQVVVINNPSTRSFLVQKLNKYTWYKFQVLAYRKEKDGPPSNEMRARTKQDAPDCSPQLLSVTPHSSTSIRVSWTALPITKCINGVLRGYKVVYRLSRTGSRLKYITVNNPSTTSVLVRGLDKYTWYRFQVLAYTNKDGPLSNAVEARTRENASATPSTSSPLQNTETKPKGSIPSIRPIQNKTVAKGEPVRLVCNATGHPSPNVSWSKVGGSLRPYYVSGSVLVIPRAELTDTGKYICTARNTYGGRDFVTSVEAFVTVKLRPHSPVPLSTQITHLTIKVHWKKPESHGYPLLMYSIHRVELDRAGQEVTSRTHHVNEDVHEYEVGDIRAGRTYRFFVTAWNTHGESVKDHSKSMTVKVQKP